MDIGIGRKSFVPVCGITMSDSVITEYLCMYFSSVCCFVSTPVWKLIFCRQLISMMDIKEVIPEFQKLNKTENCIVFHLKSDVKVAVTSPVSRWWTVTLFFYNITARFIYSRCVSYGLVGVEISVTNLKSLIFSRYFSAFIGRFIQPKYHEISCSTHELFFCSHCAMQLFLSLIVFVFCLYDLFIAVLCVGMSMGQIKN